MTVHVECYAGHRADEEPRVIELDGRRVCVAEIVRRWKAEDGRYFQVIAEDRHGYTLRHDERSGEWSVATTR